MILIGDCVQVMQALKPNSIDAIVCDPPYGLEFMGKEWDKFGISEARARYLKGESHSSKYGDTDKPNSINGRRLENKGRYSEMIKKEKISFQEWSMKWTTEAFRILKPGGSMLVMGGTRTFHRLMVAIEDSGFILKDTLMWIYGSGFPKAQDLGKMIDKREGVERKIIGTYQTGYNKSQKEVGYRPNEYELNLTETKPLTPLAKHWDGFKVGGIKPAYEPIVWAVKPPEGSYIDNVLKWGVGAVNVDETRIEFSSPADKQEQIDKNPHTIHADNEIYGDFSMCKKPWGIPNGRFPANIILDETIQGGEWTRFFYTAKASRFERNEGLEGMEKRKKHTSSGDDHVINEICPYHHITLCECGWRSKAVSNFHPTVKPISLFEWLVKLVTRKGQVVLDPFLGSGTTLMACEKSGRKGIGIEKEAEYINIAKERIKNFNYQKKFDFPK